MLYLPEIPTNNVVFFRVTLDEDHSVIGKIGADYRGLIREFFSLYFNNNEGVK